MDKFLWKLTLNEAFMDSFKVIVDAIRNEKWAVEQNEKIAIEGRIKKIDNDVKWIIDKMVETQNDIIYNMFEEKITKLEEEKQQLQAKLLSIEGSSLEDYVKEYDTLKAIIQCPIRIRKQSDIELKRLLISTIFERTLSYSDKTGTQTKEIPLIYAEKLELDKEAEKEKKVTTQTVQSLGDNSYNSSLISYATGNRTRTCTP